MATFFTHVMLRGNSIMHRGYRDGKRFNETVKYKPYLFVPNANGEYRSFVGKNPLAKIEFDSISDAKDFIEKYDGVSNFEWHGMDRWVYPFLNDRYRDGIEFDPSKIRVGFLDIETDSSGGFPNIKEADKIVTAITLSDGVRYRVWGLKEYDTSIRHPEMPVEVWENISYKHCKNESELLLDFLRVWREWDCDASSGWNTEGFDIPYLWKRLARSFGKETADQLSPYNSTRMRTFFDKMGRENETVDLHGIASLDYQQLYLKFKLQKQESYSLKAITTSELKVSKLDYESEGYETLDALYQRNHQLYIDYNIIDVARVVQLDKKMGYLNQVYAIAYDAKINLEDSITSVLLWDVIIHNKLMSRNIAVPRQRHNRKDEQISGAYVKNPRPGVYLWGLSFDLDSLYPHLIMQYNISPETFVCKIPGMKPEMVLEQDFKFSDWCDENYSMAGNGVLFRKDEQGIFAELMQEYYNDRKKYKNMMLDFERQREAEKLGANDPAKIAELTSLIIRYNNLQGAKKVGLNSAYGALSNQWFRYYNDDLAEAITLSGQVVIQWAGGNLNSWMNKTLKNKVEKDFVIASDTDSLLVTFEDFVTASFGGKLPDDEVRVVDFLDKVGNDVINPLLNKFYEELALRMNAYQQKMRMKREKIFSRGLWTGAKRYIMFVWDNEGVRYSTPKFVMTGIEAVRSSTPTACREWITEGAKVVLRGDQEELYNFIEATRVKFDAAPYAMVASNSSYNNKKNYVLGARGVPMAVAAGLNYNKLILERGLDTVKPRLNNGDRIKFSRLKMPNPTHEIWFGVPVDAANELFGLEPYIDREALWKTGFLSAMETLAESASLQTERRSSLDSFFF